ncbi:putative baseplate assembly protein [Kutzneria albida]|uniref:Uncharacterized protein n=1 Tax=Kutzneria albida DSM 43870 TaxID=1449976 RepID=W5WE57_9PSEU|nr:putative baseplate assembly protein [Kutzneria albida]AHH99468.1 hypothetical protein KALB_6108 [Kutzneria albida DSM 43870]
MALTGPILDDRTYQQLREELVRRIPVYAPEWTDHNESDPGIALLELFAYLGESLLYRFNQIPDTTKIEFLRLLGVRPRPARPARVLLTASTELPQGVQVLRDSVAQAGAVAFQTEDEVYAWPLDVLAAGKGKLPPARTAAEVERRAVASAMAGLGPNDAHEHYRTVLAPADPMDAEAVPLTVSGTWDNTLWIALLRKKATDPQQLAGRTLFLGLAFDETVPADFALQDLDGHGQDYRSTGLGIEAPPMIWQLWAGSDRDRKSYYTTVEVLGDSTGGLVSTGVVKLGLPKQLPVFDPARTNPQGDPGCPPVLIDEKQAALVVGWLRVARPATSGDSIRPVRWTGVNAVSAVQSRTAAAELLGTGTGDPDQDHPLTQRPVLTGTARVQVEEADGWRDWTEVEDFVASAPDDRHYTIDLTAGVVRFGAPRVPQPGQRIRVLSYRYGGGLVGNVPAGAIGQLGQVRAANPLPAVGGADAVSLAEALDAIPAELHRRDRAVVAQDFRDLACEVTGVVRAEVLPLLHPDTPTVRAAGVVTVVVWPGEDLRTPDAPMPDRGLLRRVAAYLDQRRLLTTELYVVPPTYQRIVLAAGVRVRAGYQVDAVRRWVELILRQYLAPVPPYGPEGGGWPLGRTVRRAELEAVAVQVDGVEYLEDLTLGRVDAKGVITEADTVELARWEVPRLVEITVVQGKPLRLGEKYTPPSSDLIVLPTLPEVC